ncbi:MAG: DUF2484 family protein [Pseudomonadota bacterium]
MTTSLVLACIWAIGANVAAIAPSRDNHWSRAYVLIAIGIPLVGFVTFENGPLVGIIVLIMGVSVLRWPVIHLSRWMRGKLDRQSH